MLQRAEGGGKIFNMILKHFKIYHDEISLEFYTDILPQTKNIFEMEAGPNLSLLHEFIKNASSYSVKKPVLVYDEEAGAVHTSGDFVEGGYLNLGFKKKLNLKFECQSKEDMFVNLVIPLEKHKKGLGVIFQKVCENGVFPKYGFAGLIFTIIGGFFGLVFSWKIWAMLGFAVGLWWFMKKEKKVDFLFF